MSDRWEQIEDRCPKCGEKLEMLYERREDGRDYAVAERCREGCYLHRFPAED